MKPLILFSAALLLAGCASHKTVWEDQDYANDMDVAKTVLMNGRMAQAEFKYQKAFDRAFLVDDAQAIHDAGFNLATSQLRQNHVTDALQTVDKTLDALDSRYFTQSADLHLIKAASFYRTKDYQKSLQEARKAQLSPDSGTSDESIAFEGYNAAALKDDALLLSSIQQLSQSNKDRNKANLLELQTLYALSHRQWEQAVSYAQSLVILRRENGDTIAMRRALELEAQAYSNNSQPEDALRTRQQIRESQEQDVKIK